MHLLVVTDAQGQTIAFAVATDAFDSLNSDAQVRLLRLSDRTWWKLPADSDAPFREAVVGRIQRAIIASKGERP